jgi:hypothetical protein
MHYFAEVSQKGVTPASPFKGSNDAGDRVTAVTQRIQPLNQSMFSGVRLPRAG